MLFIFSFSPSHEIREQKADRKKIQQLMVEIQDTDTVCKHNHLMQS